MASKPKINVASLDMLVLCSSILYKYGPLQLSHGDIAAIIKWKGPINIVTTPHPDGRTCTVELKRAK